MTLGYCYPYDPWDVCANTSTNCPVHWYFYGFPEWKPSLALKMPPVEPPNKKMSKWLEKQIKYRGGTNGSVGRR